MAIEDYIALYTPTRTEIAWVVSLFGVGVLLVFAALQRRCRVGLGAHGGVLFHTSLARLSWSTVSAVKALAMGFATRFGVQARSPRYLGRYALEQRIGQGGMGIVYRALREGSEHPLAVKMLSGKRSRVELERFEREASLTSRLTHPNTITVYDRGRTKDGVPYYAMELLDGLTLEELVERYGPLSAGRSIYLLLQVCAALDEAHRAGLVHRDIKPANIHACARRQPPDFVKLLDFGLVRDLTVGSDPAISGAAQVLGTPLYLSPEAITHPEKVDTTADIYALGAVAYFLSCGAPPFQGGSAIEVCAHHLQTAPEAPSTRHPVPSDLEAIILSCLAKDPAERPQSVRDLARALEACFDAGTWVEADAEQWWREHIGDERSDARPSGVRFRRLSGSATSRSGRSNPTPGRTRGFRPRLKLAEEKSHDDDHHHCL